MCLFVIGSSCVGSSKQERYVCMCPMKTGNNDDVDDNDDDDSE